jgi:hypothetical protein
VEVVLNTLAITSTPIQAISFKKLLEPEVSKYSHKQETYAKELRNILNSPCFEDKKGRTWVEYFDKGFDSDILLLPNKNRNKLNIYALDKETYYKDIVSTCSPVSKPSEKMFSDYANYVIEKVKEENNEFIVKLALFVLGIAMLFGIASKNNVSPSVVNKIKTEAQTKTMNTLSADTLQLTSKFVIK